MPASEGISRFLWLKRSALLVVSRGAQVLSCATRPQSTNQRGREQTRRRDSGFKSEIESKKVGATKWNGRAIAGEENSKPTPMPRREKCDRFASRPSGVARCLQVPLL